jgi:hypothetical protein
MIKFVARLTLFIMAPLSACGEDQRPSKHSVGKLTPATAARPALVIPAVSEPSSVSAEVVTMSDEIARCPATAGTTLPDSARRFGETTATLALTGGSLAMTTPTDFNPNEGGLDEEQPDDTEGDIYLEAADYSMEPHMEPISVVCRYGRYRELLQAQAMVLIPLAPQAATCRYIVAKPPRPASMICRRSRG